MSFLPLRKNGSVHTPILVLQEIISDIDSRAQVNYRDPLKKRRVKRGYNSRGEKQSTDTHET